MQGYRGGKFPLDVMWTDIDYMKDYRNFDYDSDTNFEGLPAFVDSLHKIGMRYVPILDAGISARPNGEENYSAYREGADKSIYMKINGEDFIGQVWPNDAVYPDYFDNKAI